MKTHDCRSLVAGLPLLVLPLAFAGGAEKFEAMDANGDGKLSRVEHRNAAEKMFKRLDKNRDGVVTTSELKGATESAEGSGGSLYDKFKKMDRNADGRISQMEHSTATYSMFSDFDTDKDRFLSRQELESGHERAVQEEDT